MKSSIASVTACLVAALFVRVSLAQYSFQGLGVLPGKTSSHGYGVSGDGLVAVGDSTTMQTSAPFRWTKSDGIAGLGSLGGSTGGARGVSFDGAVIVGDSGPFAFRWTKQTGMTSLGFLPGGTFTIAFGASSDGSVICGYGNVPGASDAFRWTQSTGLVDIGRLRGANHAFANAVSSDGTTIVGRSGTNLTASAFRWTQEEGMVDIGGLPGKNLTEAYSVSGSGAIVVGTSGGHAFYWTKQKGMVDLNLPSGAARAITPDGRVIVGGASIWTVRTGWLSIALLLDQHGVDLTDWVLTDAWAVSYDGRTIVGSGKYKEQTQAWIATIEAFCHADCDNSGALDIDDFICFQTAFSQDSIYADCDGSGEADIDDFICFQTEYGLGCK